MCAISGLRKRETRHPIDWSKSGRILLRRDAAATLLQRHISDTILRRDAAATTSKVATHGIWTNRCTLCGVVVDFLQHALGASQDFSLHAQRVQERYRMPVHHAALELHLFDFRFGQLCDEPG